MAKFKWTVVAVAFLPVWVALVLLGAVVLSVLVSAVSVNAWFHACIEDGIISATQALVEQMRGHMKGDQDGEG